MNDRGIALIEVLIALVIASGIIVFALNISRDSVSRSADATLQMEAIIDAESLLSRVGFDIPLKIGNFRQDSPADKTWSIDIRAFDDEAETPHAYQVSSDVIISRRGLTEKYHLTTLKLLWGDR